MLKITTPGKLIISGEHAVLYGSPALAAAIDRYVHVQLLPVDDPVVQFAVAEFQHPLISIALAELPNKIEELQTHYQEFMQGKRKVNQITAQIYDLPLYTIALFYQYLGIPFSQGLRFTISGNLPIGYGLGSSAAIIVAILRVLCKFLDRPFSPEELLPLAVQIENLQHGHSSGLDPSVCLYEGVVLYHQQQIQHRALSPWPGYLINTGQPECSTGECVEQVKIHAKNQALWDEFSAVTLACDQALQQQNSGMLYAAIKRNHQLLCQLGVVPTRIQELIAEIEQANGAAKICGAGSVRGDNCGYLLMLTEEENLQKIENITQHFNFAIEHVQLGITINH
ncbi:MAG: mevalonate kinase [Gammaproteobacteria bacterium]